jgi:UDP-3-O-[3-hydroxymyristoyl] glucosamine N-acyltransferase
MNAKELAVLLGGDVDGDESIEITGVAKIEEAKPGDLTFLSNPKYEKFIETTYASVVIVGNGFNKARFTKLPPALIRVAEPYGSFVVALSIFNPPQEQLPAGIHPTAIIADSAIIGKNCSIGPYAIIGDKCRIGDNCRIYAHVVLGNSVTIGNDCLFYAGVVIREECVVGHRVILQPGVVIGSDGFGFAPQKDGSFQKIPQRGIVVIEDDVEIQANTCVDRATMGETRLKKGTKLDNLVQIAHNVTIGENTVFAGQSGIAGSSKVGSNVMVGGNVGIAGHLVIEDRVVIAGNSGVSKSLLGKGEMYFGYPAKEAPKARRMEGALRQLPDLLVTIRQLEERIKYLEQKYKDLEASINKQ